MLRSALEGAMEVEFVHTALPGEVVSCCWGLVKLNLDNLKTDGENAIKVISENTS